MIAAVTQRPAPAPRQVAAMTKAAGLKKEAAAAAAQVQPFQPQTLCRIPTAAVS